MAAISASEADRRLWGSRLRSFSAECDTRSSPLGGTGIRVGNPGKAKTGAARRGEGRSGSEGGSPRIRGSTTASWSRIRHKRGPKGGGPPTWGATKACEFPGTMITGLLSGGGSAGRRVPRKPASPRDKTDPRATITKTIPPTKRLEVIGLPHLFLHSSPGAETPAPRSTAGG